MFPTVGRLHFRLAIGLPLALALAGASPAWAQMGGMSPGMGPGMGKPGGSSPHEEKEEGPAEVAPDAEEKAPASKDSDASYLEQSRRRTKVVEFDGYFRMRTDYLYKMNLGQGYNPGGGGGGPAALPPFPVPSECLPNGQVGNSGTPATSGGVYGACDNGLGSGNMRLRLEPTINISDQVRVRTQFDIFDNLILGSTADSLVNPSVPNQTTGVGQTSAAAPTDVLSNTQNSYTGSILAKRAWGEIDSELGSLRFGRMPWHFGRGMYFNRGDCADCDGGTTVDRFMALTTVYGHQLALAMDFGAQGYHIGYTDLGQNNTGGFPMDLSQKDDVTQFMAAITKIDDDKTWRERISAGDVMVNYGAQLVYRSQDYTTFNISPYAYSPYGATQTSGTPLTSNDYGNSLTKVDALLFIPSLWFKLGWKALTVEFEGNALLGKMGNAGPLILNNTSNEGLTILQAGFVLASQLKLYNDSLFIGFETGGATGDQAELAYGTNPFSSTPSSYYPYLNYRWKFVPQPAGDKRLTDFHFSPEYHVDEILFRRILGTVSNAIYFKPSIAYWMDLDSRKENDVGISGSIIYSIAPVPVSTPGNSMNYGVELDLGLHYRNHRENIFAGATWGIFWPMAALSRPYGSVDSVLWGTAEDTSAAQVIRTFVGIKF